MSDNGQKTILLVEDEVFIALDESQTIKQFGYEVVIAYSGEKAIDIVEKNKNISLILMDIDLGRAMDGTETARRILANNSIPIVFLTSHNEKEMVDKVHNITRYGYILKNSGDFVLQSSIEMAFELFETNKMLEKAKNDLSERNKFTESLLNLNPDIIYIYDINKQKNIYSNDGIQKVLGYSVEEIHQIENQLIPFLMHPDDLKVYSEKIIPKYSYVKDNEPVIHQYRMKNKNGEWHWLQSKEIIYKRLDDGKPCQIFGVVHDITTEKNFENAILQNQKLLKQSQQVARLGHYVLDMASGIWTSSEMLDEIFGITMEYKRTVEGWLNIVHPDHQQEMLDYFINHVVKEKNPFDKEYLICRIDTGETFWVHGLGKLEFDFAGNPVKMFGIIQDITHEKIAQNELKEREESLSITLQSIGDAVIATDVNGMITRMNKTAEQLTGWSFSDAENKPLDEVFNIINSETRIKVGNPVRKVLLTGEICGLANHTRLISRDGSEYQISDSAAPIKDDKGNIQGVILVFSDVTEKYKSEEKIRESEKLYKLILEAAPEGIVIYSASGQCITVNPAAVSMLGGTGDEILRQNFRKINSWQKCGLLDAAEEVLTTGMAMNQEFHLTTTFGKEFWAQVKCNRFLIEGEDHLLFMIQDIRKRKIAEEMLKKSEEKYRTLVEDVNIGIFQTNSQNKFIHINSTIAQMAGYDDINEFMKLPVEKFYYDQLERENLRNELIKNGFVKNIELKSLKKDGSFYYVSINAVLLKDSEGKPISILGSVQDITLQKQSEEKIVNLLKEKELILKEVHHRIKNNMNSVDSLLSLQLSHISNQEAISVIRDARTRIKSMEILYDRLYRHDTYKEISVREYLSNLVDQIAGIFPNRKSVKIEKQIDDFIINNKIIFPLGIIVNEMLTNAMKHAFNGRSNGLIQVSVLKDGTHITVSIKDNGKGMPEQQVKGFGLILIEALAGQIDGICRIENENGAKCTLEFEI